MSRESGGEQPQKTVAELLAQHGGQVDGAPRRRRRRAEDDSPDIGDTAPQAIINRVQADSAAPEAPSRRNGRSHDEQHEEPQAPRRPRAAPPQEEAGPPTRRGMPARRPVPPPAQQPPAAQQSQQPPPAPAQSAQPTQQPESYGRGRGPRPGPRQQPSQPMQVPPAQQGAPSARPDNGTDQEAAGSPMGTGGYPVPQPQPQPPPPRLRRRPLRRPAGPPPVQEPHTEQFPAVPADASSAQSGQSAQQQGAPEHDEPPAGLAGWRQRRDKSQMDDTEVGLMPPVTGQDAVEAGPATGAFTPSFDTGDQPAVDDLDGYDRPSFGAFDDDPLHEGGLRAGAVGELEGEADEADEYGYADDEPLGDAIDDDDRDAADDDLADDEPATEASPAKQWMMLAGQLALGALGGAAVWLGFNWLWVELPAAALIAALAVTVGLVLIVRKVRRAEDLQTTVLALLVGLVVTISPAALLLVSQ
ncbi:hypothetical protein [Amycolatopsis palatopharyngis]|uniref:hypothetical protein n=1 Tax=Amycolatopsis palatopharyngis TaxID=187982 RepID=UPI000E23D423|nr:hypothetical protein [Amycolatopsis palatopharyngis]